MTRIVGAPLGFGTKPPYEALGDLWVEICQKRSDPHRVSEATSTLSEI